VVPRLRRSYCTGARRPHCGGGGGKTVAFCGKMRTQATAAAPQRERAQARYSTTEGHGLTAKRRMPVGMPLPAARELSSLRRGGGGKEKRAQQRWYRYKIPQTACTETGSAISLAPFFPCQIEGACYHRQSNAEGRGISVTR